MERFGSIIEACPEFSSRRNTCFSVCRPRSRLPQVYIVTAECFLREIKIPQTPRANTRKQSLKTPSNAVLKYRSSERPLKA